MSRLRGVVAALVIGFGFACTASADEPCDKNHYILGWNCAGALGPESLGPAVEQAIGQVMAVATDAFGNAYFTSPNAVHKFDVLGNLTRIAGSITPGLTGDDGPAWTALLNIPFDYPGRDPDWDPPLISGIAVDAIGNVFIADTLNNRIRKIHTNGLITTLASGPTPGTALGQYGESDLLWPQAVAADDSGNVYFNTVYMELQRREPRGAVTTLSGYVGGTGGQIAVDVSGNVYFPAMCRVLRLSQDGTATTVAGIDGIGFSPSRCGFSSDVGPANLNMLSEVVNGVAVDRAGNLYIADTGNNCIRKVDLAGIMWTVAGLCSRTTIVRRGYREVTVRQRGGFEGDGGPAVLAKLRAPSGVAVDSFGNLYIADTGNMRLRKVDTGGIITTVAGNGEVGQPIVK